MTARRTIIKILGPDGTICTAQDIERWREILDKNLMTLEEATATGEVQIISHVIPENNGEYLTLVRIGSKDYLPTIHDLESWRQIFEEAKDTPNFKIFTGMDIDVSVIHIGKVVAVE